MKYTPAEIAEAMSVLSKVDKTIREVTSPTKNTVCQLTRDCGTYLSVYIIVNGIKFKKTDGYIEVFNPKKFRIQH